MLLSIQRGSTSGYLGLSYLQLGDNAQPISVRFGGISGVRGGGRDGCVALAYQDIVDDTSRAWVIARFELFRDENLGCGCS